MIGLVERLRYFRVWNSRHSHYDPLPICNEAATALEAKEKELEALRADYLHSQTDLQNAIGDRDEAIKQQIKAEARAETAERELDALSSSHRDLAKRLAAMGRERDEARAALKPFSDAADSLSEDQLDRMDLWESPAGMDITAGHLRAARAIMED